MGWGEKKEEKKKRKTNNTLTFIYIIAMRVKCTNRRFLRNTVKALLKEEGEGVVLRKHESIYVPARSPLLLKFKVKQEREERMRRRGEGEDILISSFYFSSLLFLFSFISYSTVPP